MIARSEVSAEYQPLWDRLKRLEVQRGDVLLFTQSPDEPTISQVQLAKAKRVIEHIVRGEVLLLGTQRGATLEAMTDAALITLHRTIGNVIESRKPKGVRRNRRAGANRG